MGAFNWNMSYSKLHIKAKCEAQGLLTTGRKCELAIRLAWFERGYIYGMPPPDIRMYVDLETEAALRAHYAQGVPTTRAGHRNYLQIFRPVVPVFATKGTRVAKKPAAKKAARTTGAAKTTMPRVTHKRSSNVVAKKPAANKATKSPGKAKTSLAKKR
eukprot:TRINITY_DN41842_c0_g1_i1.p2 TRINITY_DN41842_c0_g1~~TRINITY_DN41842_c0_g1_i1.p2  ORF type:complete len:158 (-),score=19.23 TRINITY_DN41842_c0_g1_i1:159-632(-)